MSNDYINLSPKVKFARPQVALTKRSDLKNLRPNVSAHGRHDLRGMRLQARERKLLVAPWVGNRRSDELQKYL